MHITKPQILYITISTFIAITFLVFPQVDLFVSGLFYNDEQKFFLRENPVLVFLHESVRYIAITISLVLLGAFFVSSFSQRERGNVSFLKNITKRHIIYLILCLAIGPGLVVNTIFKDNWGRARPFQTENFGGDKKFTPPFIIAGQCETNCSFTSGDPSIGFYFFAFALALPTKRREYSAFAMTLGVIFGATRILQGAHFFSDVIFSGIFVYAVCYLLHKSMFRQKTSA